MLDWIGRTLPQALSLRVLDAVQTAASSHVQSLHIAKQLSLPVFAQMFRLVGLFIARKQSTVALFTSEKKLLGSEQGVSTVDRCNVAKKKLR